MQAKPVQEATPQQARLLLDVQLRPLLMLLMKTPCTVTQLAAELKIDLNRAHHLMTRLEQAGVAVVDRLEKRAGRPVKHYSPQVRG